ncbi:MAG TPA: peptidylprolyl isomerase [Polyangiaceae bacterium]|nr:peptidylprolyl isomerase [Polyangiaceae bacterium]
MLSLFRTGIGNVVVAGIAFLIIVAFAIEFRAGRSGPSGKLSRECAVAFDGYCVDTKEYYAAHGMIVPRGVEPKVSKKYSFNKRVLDGLVERELLVAEANKLGLRVGEDALEADLMAGRVRASLPADSMAELSPMLGLCPPAPGGYGCAPGADYPVRQLSVRRTEGEPFDYKLYERQVRLMTNRGPKEFKEMQERELLAARMRDIVRSRVRIPDPEAYALYERDRSKVVVRTVSLKRDWFTKYAVEIDDAAVEKWSLSNQAQVDNDWNGNKADYTAGCMPVRELFIELPSNALDDEKPAVKLKAEQARERVVKGESFEQVARDVSQGPTAGFGGEVGCVGASFGLGADELKKALESLKPGDLSQPIETPRGYHVLKVGQKLTEQNLEHEGRRVVARRLYARFAADEALGKFAEQLITRTKAGERLEDAARALSVDFSAKLSPKPKGDAKKESSDSPALLSADRPRFEVSPPFNASGNPLPDLEPTEPIAAKAFELKQADEVYGKPLSTSTGALVMQLKERTEASKEEFVKDKPKVVEALLQAKSIEALARYVYDLRRLAGDKLKVMSEFGEEAKGRPDNDE